MMSFLSTRFSKYFTEKASGDAYTPIRILLMVFPAATQAAVETPAIIYPIFEYFPLEEAHHVKNVIYHHELD
jgi:hypothetical protein